MKNRSTTSVYLIGHVSSCNHMSDNCYVCCLQLTNHNPSLSVDIIILSYESYVYRPLYIAYAGLI